MNRLLVPSLLVPLALLTACGGDGKTCTIAGANGVQTLTCPDGTSTTIASGGTSMTGANGASGGVELVNVVAEPAGSNCTNGGSAIETGIDANGNGVLDPSEIDASATTYVCSSTAVTAPPATVLGDVTIGNSLDVAALAGVTTITGNLNVYAGTDVTSITLPTLVHVRRLIIINSPQGGPIGPPPPPSSRPSPRPDGESAIGGALVSFSAPALTTIDDELVVADQVPTFTTLDLPALTSVSTIDLNGTSVSNLGLPSLKTVEDAVGVYNSPLASLAPLANAFAAFTGVEDIDLEGNHQLADVTALAKVAKLHQLRYYDNGATALALDALTTITEGVDIGNDSVLTSLSFKALTTTTDADNNEFDVYVDSNTALTTLSFPALTTASYIEALSDAALANVSFPVLATVNDALRFDGFAATTIAFPDLTDASFLGIDDSPGLVSISLPLLTTRYLEIQYDDALTTISAPALSVGGTDPNGATFVSIQCNGSLQESVADGLLAQAGGNGTAGSNGTPGACD